MDKLDLYKNEAQEKTIECIEEFIKTYKTDGTMVWHQYCDFIGNNLLTKLKEIHSFYIKRDDSNYREINVEDFCMPFITKYQTTCLKYIDDIQGL